MRNRDWDNKLENRNSILKSKREWYYRNKNTVNAINKKNRKRAWEWIQNYKKEHPCACGENHVAALDFHHLDPSKKELQITMAAGRGWSVTALKKEISKCIVLCANCHRKFHWNEKHTDVSAQSSKL